MTPADFRSAWASLKRQVRKLGIPWLDTMAAKDNDPFKVLISCILSLRTQDKTTAEASSRLFALADTPEAVALLLVETIEKVIYPVGFYRVKAERIREMSREIVERHKSRVPDSIDELLTLRGVGRKTANLVVTLGYGKPGICVDTHVHRITNRWGLVQTGSPKETEFALRETVPVRYWKELNGNLVAFGQHICKPLSPLCSQCTISGFCERVGVRRSR